MAQCKLLLSDLDGTLIDTHRMIIDCFVHAMQAHLGVTVHPDDFTPVFGQSIENVFHHLCQIHSVAPTPELIETLIAVLRDYQRKVDPSVRAFPHTHAVLAKLRAAQIKIAVITTVRKPARRLEFSRLKDQIDFVVSGEDVKNMKPDPEGLLKAIAHFGIEPSEAIMMGDTPPDIEAGKNAGVKTIGVTYGQLGQDIVLSHPDFVIDSIDEALQILI